MSKPISSLPQSSSVPGNSSALNLNSSSTRSLKILSLNVRSLLPKFDEFCLVCASLSPDIICVSETWLSQDIPDNEIALINYQLFRKDRNRHGGGVLLYIHSNIFAVPLKLSCDLELLLVSVKVFNQTFTLGSYYRPPSLLNGVSDLVEVLSSIPPESIQNLIIAGDFNVDMSSPSGRLFSDLSSLLNSFSLSQIVCSPTRTPVSGSCSIIDLVLVSNNISASSVILPPVSSSDHNSVLSTVSFRSTAHFNRQPSKRKIWLYHLADFDMANFLLSSIPWDTLLSSDLDLSWNIFKDNFMRVIDHCIPSKYSSPSSFPPWIDSDLKMKIKRRQKLFTQAKRFNSSTIHQAYCSLRNNIISTIRLKRFQFFRSLSSSSPKKFWSYVRSTRKTSSSVPPLTFNDKIFTSDCDKADILNKYFSGCFNSSIPPLSSFFPAFCQSSLPPTYLCTQSQVLSLIANLPLDSASGPDFISTRMLKYTAHSIVSPLTHIFNLSLSSGHVPSDWKNSFIVPIPKSSSNTSDPSNYRPISLLSVISKILEKHVHSILYSFCLDHNLVSPYQFGFLPNRSTSSALLFATNSFHKILQNNKAICACFLDLKKAFDSVPHAPLIDLLSSLNCPPLYLNGFIHICHLVLNK